MSSKLFCSEACSVNGSEVCSEACSETGSVHNKGVIVILKDPEKEKPEDGVIVGIIFTHKAGNSEPYTGVFQKNRWFLYFEWGLKRMTAEDLEKEFFWFKFPDLPCF